MLFEEALERAKVASKELDQATAWRQFDEPRYIKARNAAVTAFADLVEATHARLREIRPELK